MLLDLNGVLYSEDQALPGAIDVVDFLHINKIPVRYLTNTTTLTCSEMSIKLTSMGLNIAKDAIISPAQAAVLYLRRLKKPSVHLVVDDNIKSEFSEFNVSHTNPTAIVVGDIGARWNYMIMNKLFEMITYGAQLIALHKNRYWQVKGKLHIDIGAFICGLEYASGHESVVLGKPAESFYDLAILDLGMQSKDVFMIGDDIFSDVEGAHNAGIKAGIVKTGKYREELVLNSQINTDFTFNTIGDLIPWMKMK